MPIDELPLSVLITIAIFAWTLFLITILVSLRRAKVRRDKQRRLIIRAARRESHIQLANEADTTISGRKNR